MKNTLLSYTDFENLIKIINDYYKLDITQLYLHREMIGYVYIAQSDARKYVLKLYRPFNMSQALQSIDIIEYLRKNGYPAVTIIPTHCDNRHIELYTPHGESIAILYDFIEGTEPNIKSEIAEMGKQIGQLHTLMKGYQGTLIHRGKEFYIDRYISMLRELQYCDERIKDLEQYGAEIWSAVSKLPDGFCHGDLHSGNMFRTAVGTYALFDFDTASNAHSIIDIATLCNDTHFNRLEESAYGTTMAMLERFHQGYSKSESISDAEIAAIMNFIAARHYELIATITECQGLQSLDEAFVDQQYKWLMEWRNTCIKKSVLTK